MPNASILGFQTGRKFAEAQPLPFEVDDLPEIPALPETLLRMELKLHEFSIDLDEISQLVLSDAGATLQILRLAARECDAADLRPTRMADCIADLGLEACLRAAGRKTVLSEARHRGVVELWAHSREVAQWCRKLAAETHGRIHPDDAGLVGLAHSLGTLPGVLGWPWPDRGAGGWMGVGMRLATLWSLPSCIQEYFTEMNGSDVHGPWTCLLQQAHNRSRLTSRCPMCELTGPQLYRG